jgi:diguanylate cyclase (GGDEF)-like protein
MLRGVRSWEEAHEIAQRVRQNVQEMQLPVAPSWRVTVSIGADLVGVGQPFGEALQHADRALYAAKTRGRNRVVLCLVLTFSLV